ncbi:MAG: Eco57I restriction-modification methylase domain-containing protein [Thermoproteota archaeon]
MRDMHVSAQIDVDKVLVELKTVASRAANEEEFKVNAERILYNEVLSKLGLQPGKYEYTFVSGGRADALYGHVLIEYKAPGKLLKDADIAKAKKQIIDYIKKEAEAEDRYKLFLGIILCDKIAFVRYDTKTKDWLLRGPYELNRETVLRLIEAIRGLRKKKLVVDELLRDFGPGSSTTKNAVRIFYVKVTKSRSPKVKALFNDWRRVFSQVCAYSPDKLKGLETEYEIIGNVNYDALLFSIHTYYALIMKLLGAEVAYLYGAGKWLKSYVLELEDAHMKSLEALKTVLEDLESGGVFRSLLNITNFLEGDYFSWYLEELDEELASIISEIAKGLSEYEPATPVLEPEYTRDLLKRLYQNLVPKKIRHDLGEYYTPDWLAELVLNEVGITLENMDKISEEENDAIAPLNLRVLDPACGSGTFLVLAMKRFREYAEEHYLKDVLANYLLKNVVGFDLNPLAVLAARTNYLLTIADLFPYIKGPIEIPVYLSDSLLVEERSTLTSKVYIVRTFIGEFQIPQSIVERGLLGKLLEVVDKYVKLRYKTEDFEQIVKNEFNLEENEMRLLVRLYETFLKLEEEGRNHIWTSIIKNAFAPLTITRSVGKFNFVVGNPPWINWESLPESYRESTKSLWNSYGLLEKTKGMGLGKVKRDMAMLFMARCFDQYVNKGGKLSFLIPYTAYKTQAGAGFRRWLANNCKVEKIHDLVTLYPFEGAINRTSLIVVVREGQTKFPIPCVMWHNPRHKGIETEAELEEVKKATSQFNMIFTPVKKGKPETPWMMITEKVKKAIENIVGESPWYKAYEGINTALNSIYWIDILSKQQNGLLIVPTKVCGQKKKVKEVKTILKPDLIYPLIRGRDVKRWFIEPHSNYIILPTNENGETLEHGELKVKYPKEYEYFLNFIKDLTNRSGEPYKSKLEPYRKKPINRAEKEAPPFYWLFNVSPSLAKYKVVWKRIAGGITGKAVSFASAVIEPVKDKYLEDFKPVVLNDSLILIPFDKGEEAYYVSGVLNSSPVLFTIASYTYELRMETHITQYLKIPKFNPKDKLHLKLSELSKKAHELAKKYYEQNDLVAQDELKKVEEEIDKAVAELYSLSDEELKEIKECLAILKGEEVEEEVEEEEPKQIKVDFLDTVVRPKTIGSFEVAILNPLKEKVRIELSLPERAVTVETDKEEDRMKIKVPPLEAGEYKISYKVTTPREVIEDMFTLYVKEQEKHREREEFTSKLDELLGD